MAQRPIVGNLCRVVVADLAVLGTRLAPGIASASRQFLVGPSQNLALGFYKLVLEEKWEVRKWKRDSAIEP